MTLKYKTIIPIIESLLNGYPCWKIHYYDNFGIIVTNNQPLYNGVCAEGWELKQFLENNHFTIKGTGWVNSILIIPNN